MKYGLMTDIHLGLKKNSKIILEWQLKAFYKSIRIFKENNVENIIILGDVFDNRISNSTHTIDVFRTQIVEPLRKNFKHIYFIIGNHDMFYKNKRDCNIISSILENRYNNVYVIDEISRVNGLLLVPWICKKDDIHKIVEERKNGGILLGHLEINGFRMTVNGKVCDNGVNPTLFKGFDLVLSGHFHLREKIKNIQYLGTMIGLSWAEYHGDHGVHILDSSNSKLDFYPLNISMFDVIKFENRQYQLEELEKYKNKIIKIIVKDGEDGLYQNLTNQLSNICFSYSKQYINSSKKNTEENSLEEDEDKEISKTDKDLVEEYLLKNIKDGLKIKIFMKLYHNIYEAADQMISVMR